jgi:hypothetical protein
MGGMNVSSLIKHIRGIRQQSEMQLQMKNKGCGKLGTKQGVAGVVKATKMRIHRTKR